MLFRSNDTATTEIYTLSLHDALPIFSASKGRTKLVLRPKQEQLLQLLRAQGSLSPREIWDGLRISKQGAMDLLRPLLKAGLIERVGTLKHGRYVLK